MVTPPPFGRTVPGNRWDLLPVAAEPRRVSVIVLHYDQPRQLERTLAALARQRYPRELVEVIVTDDGSPSAPDVPPEVSLVRQDDAGFRAAAARNRGAAAAHGDILCFLDADTTPEPDYLSRICRLPSLAPEAIVVGRRRHADLRDVPADTPVERAGPAHALVDPPWLSDGYAHTRDLLDADERSYRYIISAVLACSRWFFDQVGGFDERFRDYGGEDWEWAHRAWCEGAIFAHEPAAVAWHDGPEWGDRTRDDVQRRARKNRETIQLAGLVPVAGSRAAALRPERPDVVFYLPPHLSPAAAFVAADVLLAAVPHGVVATDDPASLTTDQRVVDRRTAGGLRPRLRVEMTAALRRVPTALGDALALAGSDGVGAVALTGPDGVPLLTVRGRRAAVRAQRWGDSAGAFETRTLPADGARELSVEPDLEAYLGGWDR